jgi:hypothetical protein
MAQTTRLASFGPVCVIAALLVVWARLCHRWTPCAFIR